MRFHSKRLLQKNTSSFAKQAANHVTGPCGWSISKRKDLLLSLLTGFLFLPLAQLLPSSSKLLLAAFSEGESDHHKLTLVISCSYF